MKYNPRKIIRYSSNCPKLITRNTIVKNRETKCTRDRSVPYFVVSLLEGTVMNEIKTKKVEYYPHESYLAPNGSSIDCLYSKDGIVPHVFSIDALVKDLNGSDHIVGEFRGVS